MNQKKFKKITCITKKLSFKKYFLNKIKKRRVSIKI